MRITMKSASNSNPKTASRSDRNPSTHSNDYRQRRNLAHLVPNCDRFIKAAARRITQHLNAVQAVEQRKGELTTLLAKQELQAQDFGEQLAAATKKPDALATQVQEMELEMA